MLHDFKELMPNLTIAGIDISHYAIEHAIETVKPFLRAGSAMELPYDGWERLFKEVGYQGD